MLAMTLEENTADWRHVRTYESLTNLFVHFFTFRDLNAITENLKRFQLELNRGKPSTSTGTKPKPASTTTTPKKPGSAGATPKKPSSSSAGTTPKKPSTSTVDTPKKPATDAKDQSMSDSDNKKMEVDAASAATGGADGNSIEEAALGAAAAAAAAGPAPTEVSFTKD